MITLREGLEAALVVGLMLAYLKRIGRVDLKSFVYLGLILAVSTSALAAFIFQTLSFGEAVTDIVEAYIMLLGSFFVGTMIIWMFRAASSLRHQVEQRIDTVVNRKTRALQGLGLLLLAFMLVFREGVEIILFISALSFRIGSNPFLIISGGLLGMGIAVLLGLLILKGLVKIDLRIFFTGTGLVLLALIATLMAKAIHNFAEFGIISLTAEQLLLIGLLVREDTSILILVSLIAVPALMITLDPLIKRRTIRVVAEERPAQRRLRLAEERRMMAVRVGMGIVLLIVIISVGISWASVARAGYDPPVYSVVPEAGKVKIQLSELSDGLMHKYSVDTHGVIVRFFLIQTSDGTLRVALDVCYICPPAGYYMKGDTVVCKNCDAPINIDTIGMPGGCNPRVLKFQKNSSHVFINFDDLENSARYFVEKTTL